MPNLAANSTLSLLDIVSIFCCSDDWSLSRLLLELVMKRGICSDFPNKIEVHMLENLLIVHEFDIVKPDCVN